MIDFSKVKGIKIPDGNAVALAINGTNIYQQPEQWDVEWAYSGSRPPTANWSYPRGTSLITASSAMGAVKFAAPTDNDVALIELNTSKHAASNQCVFEIEFNIDLISYAYPGVNFVLAGPMTNYVSPAIRCQAAIGATEGIFINAGNASREIRGDTWYTLRIELDNVSGNGRVYLNKELLCEVGRNGIEDYYEGEGPQFWTRDSTCYVRALRYRASL